MFTSTQIEVLLNKYVTKGGAYTIIEEGVLGHGTVVAFGENLKTAIIKERYINPWSSLHSIRMYNKTPKKYLKYLNK